MTGFGRSYPNVLAGVSVAASTASTGEMPSTVTARRTATSSSSVDPAIAPLETNRACPSTTFTSNAPSLYGPSGQSVAAIASVTNAVRCGAKPNPSRTIGSWTWKPSLMISMVTRGSSTAAGIGPGSRWCRPFIALNICVMMPAPASKPRLAMS